MPTFFLPRSWAEKAHREGWNADRCYAQHCCTRYRLYHHRSRIGFTALRQDHDDYLLFCLPTGEWSIYDGRTAALVHNGFGLAAFLAAARHYFDLPAESAHVVQRQYAA